MKFITAFCGLAAFAALPLAGIAAAVAAFIR